MISLSLIANARKPFFVAIVEKETAPRDLWLDLATSAAAVGVGLSFEQVVGGAYRCVAVDRLPQVLATGIDVEPTTRTFYVGDFEKAMEYGSWPKILLVLDYGCLDRPYRRVRDGASDDEIAHLRATFPTELHDDKGRLWLTRVTADRLRGFQYEIDYGRWIPGAPWDALLAAFILQRAGDDPEAKLVRMFEAAAGGDGSP